MMVGGLQHTIVLLEWHGCLCTVSTVGKTFETGLGREQALCTDDLNDSWTKTKQHVSLTVARVDQVSLAQLFR